MDFSGVRIALALILPDREYLTLCYINVLMGPHLPFLTFGAAKDLVLLNSPLMCQPSVASRPIPPLRVTPVGSPMTARYLSTCRPCLPYRWEPAGIREKCISPSQQLRRPAVGRLHWSAGDFVWKAVYVAVKSCSPQT